MLCKQLNFFLLRPSDVHTVGQVVFDIGAGNARSKLVCGCFCQQFTVFEIGQLGLGRLFDGLCTGYEQQSRRQENG